MTQSIFSPITPEEAGIPSEAVHRFLDYLEQKRLCMHSLMMIRHGRIAVEAYWPFFTASSLQRMYSISKSFVSIAVGLMIAEGRLALTDPVAAFFPDKLPTSLHPYIAQATVRDLLMMATPYSENTYGVKDPDWVWTHFNREPSHPAGRVFSYDTSGTVTLCAIVERLSGQKLLDYLRPRLLDPIGFSSEASCIETPCGFSWGGSGILCTTRDLAKFAWTVLQEGCWGDRQLLPRDYVQAATSWQIDTQVSQNNVECRFGYGYQFWCHRHHGFSCIGMGGQYAIALPDKDFLLVTTADTQATLAGAEEIYDALWSEILPHLADNSLPAAGAAFNGLQHRLASLKLPLPDGKRNSSRIPDIDGQTYQMNANVMQLTRIQVDFTGNEIHLGYVNASGAHQIVFGLGHYMLQDFPEPGYFGSRIGQQSDRLYRCIAAAAWADDRSLVGMVYIIDHYLGTLKINLAFQGDEITVRMTKVAEWFLEEYQGFAGGRISTEQ